MPCYTLPLLPPILIPFLNVPFVYTNRFSLCSSWNVVCFNNKNHITALIILIDSFSHVLKYIIACSLGF